MGKVPEKGKMSGPRHVKKESGFTATSEDIDTPRPSNYSDGRALFVISRSCASCSQLST